MSELKLSVIKHEYVKKLKKYNTENWLKPIPQYSIGLIKLKDDYIEQLQSRITELEKDNAFLTDFVDIRHDFDFMLEAYGENPEPMTKGAEAIRDWMQENVIKPKARIEELEKSQVVWHKYPDEKPEKPDGFDGMWLNILTIDEYGCTWIGTCRFIGNELDMLAPQTTKYWAYLLEPPKEER